MLALRVMRHGVGVVVSFPDPSTSLFVILPARCRLVVRPGRSRGRARRLHRAGFCDLEFMDEFIFMNHMLMLRVMGHRVVVMVELNVLGMRLQAVLQRKDQLLRIS